MADRCYVNSVAQVSCQQPLCDEWFESPRIYSDSYVRAIEPDTSGFISSSEARRMSRILRRAVCTAFAAVAESDVSVPGAVITGTGSGCIENSEKFLVDMGRYGEESLKPTLFMQSTHNTVSSLIAIMMKCHGYNSTYSHKGISFESALLDAWLQMRCGMLSSALVGSHDEVTPFMGRVMRRTHPYGSFVSEASVSTVLSAVGGPADICEITDVQLMHRPAIEDLAAAVDPDRDSVLMLGVNGNHLNDKPYESLLSSLGFSPRSIKYRNVFGDNYSVSALGFYAACRILQRQRVPEFMRMDHDLSPDGCIDGITVINHSEGTDWSLVRLRKV